MYSERVSRSLRLRVQERAKGLCEYCQAPANCASASFHCEHIYPRKIGGRTSLDNLALACPWCNSAKHTKTHALDPQTDQRVPLFNPRLQNWNRHFMWSENFLHIIGRTRSGRATVEALNMNRLEQVNMRIALRSMRKYPPEIDILDG
jgi:hypothetical protein